jgi:hypothetical protein
MFVLYDLFRARSGIVLLGKEETALQKHHFGEEIISLVRQKKVLAKMG